MLNTLYVLWGMPNLIGFSKSSSKRKSPSADFLLSSFLGRETFQPESFQSCKSHFVCTHAPLSTKALAAAAVVVGIESHFQKQYSSYSQKFTRLFLPLETYLSCQGVNSTKGKKNSTFFLASFSFLNEDIMEKV